MPFLADSPRLKWALLALAGLGLAALASFWVFISALERDLPAVASLKTLQLQVPLTVYTRDGKLIGEFGTERRALLTYAELPPPLVNAFLAAEDDDFFQHSGVDYLGLARAALKLASTGEKAQGGSTITMQLARNLFLSSEKTFTRKFREILLARKIERELSKEEILALYLNKIFLGERAYGVGAAALAYFGKPAADLSVAEMAVLAALPKAPSRDNPVANPARSLERRNYVLRRMLELKHLQPSEYETALAEPIVVRPYRATLEAEADYVAELIRTELYAQYGEDLYARGFKVTATVDSRQQAIANRALRDALHDYDERHGWRGAEATVALDEASLRAALAARPPVMQGVIAAVVTAWKPDQLDVVTASGPVRVGKDGLKWANLSEKKPLKPGEVIRLRRQGEAWRLAQVPEVEGAFVAVNPNDGSVQALAGGYDFFLNKFNHVTQARRQAGSGFKPFLYAAGLNAGFTAASVFLDAPVVFEDSPQESGWRPENYDSEFSGPMRLREALVQSRNLVSVRLLQAVGIDAARDFAPGFGIPKDRLPRDLTMALGSAVFTPLEMARFYSTLANGGSRIEPYFIHEIRDGTGQLIFSAKPKRVCVDCAEAAPRGVDAGIAWQITSILQDVTRRGTAAAVAQLGRSDLAGKTGTTNDETDAWFNGYQKNLVGIAWVGFDQPQPLGRGEVGGKAALPIWMDYMKAALKNVPQEQQPRPMGLVDVRINPDNGKLAQGDGSAITETVPQDRIPEPDDGLGLRDNKAGVEDIF